MGLRPFKLSVNFQKSSAVYYISIIQSHFEPNTVSCGIILTQCTYNNNTFPHEAITLKNSSLKMKNVRIYSPSCQNEKDFCSFTKQKPIADQPAESTSSYLILTLYIK